MHLPISLLLVKNASLIFGPSEKWTLLIWIVGMLYNLPNAVSKSDSAHPVGLYLLDKQAAIHLRSDTNHT